MEMHPMGNLTATQAKNAKPGDKLSDGDGLRGAVRNAVGIRYGVFPGNMKLSFQAARSIG